MTNPVAFSYSRLQGFETCPKKFHATSISKKFKEPETEQMLYGKAVHKALELRVTRGTKLPEHLTHLERIVAPLAASSAVKLAEYQMCVNASLEPVEWFSKDAYCRAIADLIVDNGDKAALFDYKTGRKYDEFDQLRLTGALYFLHAPKVQTIRCAFVWTKDRSITSTIMHRHEMADIWSELSPRIEKYQLAFRTDEFPPRPGRHCRWCVVKTCPNWEGK